MSKGDFCDAQDHRFNGDEQLRRRLDDPGWHFDLVVRLFSLLVETGKADPASQPQ